MTSSSLCVKVKNLLLKLYFKQELKFLNLTFSPVYITANNKTCEENANVERVLEQMAYIDYLSLKHISFFKNLKLWFR